MGRINTYPNTTRPAKTDELLIDGSAGTRNVLMSDAAIEMAGMISNIMHNNIIRGKNLGSSYTDAQKAAIRNGTFDDLYIGDYWTINGVVHRIADMDYWYGQGDTACTTHHVVIIPDSQLYTHKMNDTNITEGGYTGSKMYTEGLTQAKNTINSAFGSSYILNHREYLTNAITNGKPSGGGWFDSTVELPNEIMMYGCPIFTPTNDGSTIPALHTIDKSQLALMRMSTYYINPQRQYFWLRDVVSAAYFALVLYYGLAYYGAASGAYGVRPVFGIHG